MSAYKQCLEAVLMSGTQARARTYGRTNEELLTSISLVALRIARRGAEEK